MEQATQKINAKRPATDSMTPAIQIPGYKILRELGHGGMAHVYLAIQESFGREVALKVLSPHLADDEQFSKRFLREVRIVSQLNHPNIVTVYDAGKHKQYHYMSMEYIPGKDLKQLKESLSTLEAIHIIKDVASALNFAGEKGIVHRDIKPENIMIHETDKRVILMDFGIAHGDDVTHGMTQAGKALGTPHFMSPEQTKGLEVDQRSDIYSLGIALYQLLAGYLPFDASSAVAVGIKHLTAPIPLLPKGLEIFQSIVNTCLSKEPEHRYQKAAELIAALDKITDAQIANISTEAALFRQTGADHNLKTQISDAIGKKDKIPDLVFPVNNKKTLLNVEPAVIDSRIKRRRNLIILLLICTSVWAAIEKQNELSHLWGNKVLPKIVGNFPGLFSELYVKSWMNKSLNNKNIQPTTVLPIVQSATANTTENMNPINHLAETNTTKSEIETSAKTIKPVMSEADRISLLKNEMDDNSDNAIELAAIYKGMLQKSQQNPVARQGLIELREWYVKKIQQAFTSNNMPMARKYIYEMKQGFPRADQSKRLTLLQEKISAQESINAHIFNANKYYNAGALSKPAGKNALDEIKIVLRMAPENTDAKNFYNKIVNTYLEKTLQLQEQRNLPNAIRMIDEGIAALGNKKALINKRKDLSNIIKQNKKITTLLDIAKKHQTSGRLIEPQSRNAYAIYQDILSKEKNNLQAKSGLKSIHQSLAEKILADIRDGQLTSTEKNILAATQRYGKTPLLESAQLKLNQALEARLPKILIVRLSEIPFTTLDIENSEILQLKRTLYIGFNFINFESATTLLQAALYDGAEKVKIAQKPVIITSSSGEQFFNINIPVDGFTDGSYKLNLAHNNKVLSSKSFLVRAAVNN